jgi:hypothetical protein
MGTRFPFRQDQLSTFLQLVNDSNPGLVLGSLTAADLRTITPVALATPDAFGRDTSVRLMVKPGNGKYFGTQTVYYRRISLGYLFNKMGVASGQVFPVLGVSGFPMYSGAGYYTTQDLVDELNNKYGLTLTLYDFRADGTNVNLITSSGGTAWVSLVNSLCYKSTNDGTAASIQIQWTKPKQPLNTLFKATPQTLTGRTYPGGNSFPTDGSRKPQADFFLYGADASSLTSTITALGSTATNADFTTTALSPILSWMQRMRPDLNFSSANCATAGGLNGVTFTKYALPAVNALNANSIKYTNVLVLTPPASGSCWFQGTIYLHYGVRSTAGTSVASPGFYLNSEDQLFNMVQVAAVAVSSNGAAIALGSLNAATGWSVFAMRPTKGSDSISQNTKIRMLMGASNTTYAGYKDIFYDRLDLGALANFNPYQVSVTPGVSVLTVLDKIRDQYGIQLTANDINDVQTVDRDGDGKYTTVTLTSKPTSLGWIGSVTLTFLGLPDISQAFISQSLGGF